MFQPNLNSLTLSPYLSLIEVDIDGEVSLQARLEELSTAVLRGREFQSTLVLSCPGAFLSFSLGITTFLPFFLSAMLHWGDAYGICTHLTDL